MIDTTEMAEPRSPKPKIESSLALVHSSIPPLAASSAPSQTPSKLHSLYSALPIHFSGRIKEIDSLLAKILLEIHSGLVLSLGEILKIGGGADEGSLSEVSGREILDYVAESEEWDQLFSGIRKKVVGFRKELKKDLQGVASVVELPEECKTNIEGLLSAESNKKAELGGVKEFSLNIKKGLSDIASILGNEEESRIDHHTIDQPIKNILTGLEEDTNYLEAWFSKKTGRIKEDIVKCWNLLKRERDEELKVDNVANMNDEDSSLIVRQLKATFKYYHNHRLIKNIVNLESTIHRIGVTSDDKFVYAGGNGCKLRKREIAVSTNNIFSDKKYNIFGLCVDSEDKCWVHDGHINQIIGFDANLKEKCVFNGLCFNQCGFASTDATYAPPSREKLFWHKGKGVLSCITFREEKEMEYVGVVSSRLELPEKMTSFEKWRPHQERIFS